MSILSCKMTFVLPLYTINSYTCMAQIFTDSALNVHEEKITISGISPILSATQYIQASLVKLNSYVALVQTFSSPPKFSILDLDLMT